MNLLLMGTPENRMKMEGFLQNYTHFMDCTVTFQWWEEGLCYDSQIGKVVFDEQHITQAAAWYRNQRQESQFALWMYDTVIPLDDGTFLDQIQSVFLTRKNWVEVKRINRTKIALNWMLERRILTSYPSQLQMETTSFCNAQCIMCSHYYAGNQGAREMGEEMHQRLLELLPYLDVIILHGNGEPFLGKGFEEMVQLYASYGIGLTTNTNLSILSPKLLDIIRRTFVEIRVSCDACTKENYEGIRRNLSYETFVSNAKALRDACPNLTKIMTTVVMRQNLAELPQMVDFAADLGFAEIIFSNLGTSLLVGNERDNVTHYPNYAAQQFRLAQCRGEVRGIRVVLPDGFILSLDDETARAQEQLEMVATPFYHSQQEWENIKSFAQSVVGEDYGIMENLSDCLWEEQLYPCQGICEWCIEKAFIDLRGNVCVCCINASYRVGNLFESHDFLSLWNGPLYQKIRGLFYQGQLPGFCDNCQFILNHSLHRLKVENPPAAFYQRRHISKFYHDYCEVHGNV